MFKSLQLVLHTSVPTHNRCTFLYWTKLYGLETKMEWLDHALLNRNQLRNFQLDVYDNPFDHSTKDLHIDTQSGLQIPLKTKGTVINFITWAPTHAEIDANPQPHPPISSTAEWIPSTFRFLGSTEDKEEDYLATMNISSFMTDHQKDGSV